MTTRFADRRLRLHPRVALRPEPFGALAYHYDNRKLVFLKHPDVVKVVGELDGASTVSEALSRCDITDDRHNGFERALANLVAAEMLTDADATDADATDADATDLDRSDLDPMETDDAGAR